MEEVNKGENDARRWAMLCHLSALSAYIGVPFGNYLGPLLFWLLKKGEHPFIDDQGKESLNFQLSFLIYTVVAAITIIGIILIPALAIISLVFAIVASVKAGEGVAYRYPMTIRLIK